MSIVEVTRNELADAEYNLVLAKLAGSRRAINKWKHRIAELKKSHLQDEEISTNDGLSRLQSVTK